jgi:phosphoribosylglycinamide formyltransferase-1
VTALPSRRPVVVLISGRGSNLRCLVEQSRSAESPYFVAGVFSDRAGAPGLDLARDLQVPATALPAAAFADRTAYDLALAERVAAVDPAAGGPALVVLAGFMRILSAGFIARFPGRILNIHPSLLRACTPIGGRSRHASANMARRCISSRRNSMPAP